MFFTNCRMRAGPVSYTHLQHTGAKQEDSTAAITAAKGTAKMCIRDRLSDIRERGVILRWENGPYASGYKRNESLPALRMVIRRMAHMRRALGLIPDGESRTRDSEEEL